MFERRKKQFTKKSFVLCFHAFREYIVKNKQLIKQLETEQPKKKNINTRDMNTNVLF